MISPILVTFLATAASVPLPLVVPPPLEVDQVVEHLVKADQNRLAALEGYTGMRRYRVENQRFHKTAEMLVRVTCSASGVKTFQVVSESGSSVVRRRVLGKLIETEEEASTKGERSQTRIVPDNYEFRLLGMDTAEGRPAYLLEIRPKTDSRLLVRGRIWVDAEEFAITRIEASPAKNPSFWTRSIVVVHQYTRVGPFWLPVSNRSLAEARIFGETNVTIEYFDYVVNGRYRGPAQPLGWQSAQESASEQK